MKNKAISSILDLIKKEEQNLTAAITELFTKRVTKRHTFKEYYEDIVTVRTIWKMETTVHIDEFYCQPKVISLTDNTISTFEFASEFPVRSALITGPAGQGKSIFLRKLCYNEYKKGEYFPVFISLRTLKGKQPSEHCNFLLYQLIFEQCQLMGLFPSEVELDKRLVTIIDKILDSGKLILLLDGFDELLEADQEVCANEFNTLHQKFLDLKLFLTSRPEAEKVYKTPFMATFRIKPLEQSTAKLMIKKYSESPQQSKLLIDAIKEHDYALQLFTTPLLITIMVIVYKSIQKIPESLSEFYEYAIIVLLSRHDGTKPGFERERESNLSDPLFCKVFNAFCYITARDNKLSLTQTDLVDYSKEALKKAILDIELAVGYASDINKITNLLVKDGINYVFVHKTIQEYFSAKYVSSLTDENAKTFYQLVFSKKDLMSKWSQQLTYLKYIDQYRFTKFFLLKNAERIKLLCIDVSESKIDLSPNFLDVLDIRYRATGKLDKCDNASVNILCQEISFPDPAELWTDFKSKLKSLLGPKLEKLIHSKIVGGLMSEEFAESGFHVFDTGAFNDLDKENLRHIILESGAYSELVDRLRNTILFVKQYEEEQADSTELGKL